MKIIFIHSGKSFYEHLGPHYAPLIKHSLHLLPIDDYLNLTNPQAKNKYRPIQSLPSGYIIGVVLIDKSFWFNSEHLSDPWSHGPYCYRIKDAFRLQAPIQCRGNMGGWKIAKKIRNKIQEMSAVMNKINEWKNTYNMNNSNESNDNYDMFTALTIMQPFAESIMRKIKTVENRSSKLLGCVNNHDNKSDGEGEFEGCRICITRKLNKDNNNNNAVDYVKYGQQFVKGAQHTNIPKCSQTDYKYNPRASLMKCPCGKLKRAKRKRNKKINNENNANNDGKENNNNNNTKKKKKKKLPALHEIMNYNKRRKPSRKRQLSKSNYYVAPKVHNTRARANGHTEKNKKLLSDQLIAMGFDTKQANIASDKYKRMMNTETAIVQAIEYLHTLDKIQHSSNTRKRKRKREDINISDNYSENNMYVHNSNNNNNSNKRRKICGKLSSSDSDSDGLALFDKNKNYKRSDMCDALPSDYDEECALSKAMKESALTYSKEKNRNKSMSASNSNSSMIVNKKKKKLSSSVVKKIPRRRC